MKSNKNVQPYLIRLTPTGSFFFGGERSLAGTGNDAYLVRSRHFPQQTSLLGLLRYQVLAANGLLKEPHKGGKIPAPLHAKDQTPEQLIGAKGFQNDQDAAFGAIEGLSPVMLARGDTFFTPMMPSAHMTFSENTGGKAGSVFEESHRDFIPALAGFDPKNMPDTLLFSTDGSAPVKMDSVYQEKMRVGISKNKKHYPWLFDAEKTKAEDAPEMEGFFKQMSYAFSDASWSFAFVAWLEAETGKKLTEYASSNPLATLGAERSMFHFGIKPCKAVPDFAAAFPAMEKEVVRVVLLSDAWADPQDLYQNCLFAHSESQEFRYLQSEVATTTNYYRRGEKAKPGDSLSRSGMYHLFKRGSVFFCKESQIKGLTDILKDKKISGAASFRRIGYNAFAEVRANIKTNFFQP